jgi:DNA-binding NarL/FixJ family response regulator
VRLVATGESLVFPSLTRDLVERYSVRIDPQDARALLLGHLTEREAEILQMIARGRSNAEIAAELVVAIHTVKTHVANMLAKLAVRDRTQAVIFAYETGFVRAGDRSQE